MAAVRAAAAERFAREALARIGDAQRPVDEHFELDRRLAADRANFWDRELAGQHHALDAELLGRANAFAAGERHLRRSVDRQVGTDRAQQPDEAEVLHEHGIDARFGEPHDMLLDRFELRREDERVERHIAADRPVVQKTNDLRQLVEMQIRRPRPRVEPRIEPEVNSIRPVLNGRRHAHAITGRRKQLRPTAFGLQHFVERLCHVDAKRFGNASGSIRPRLHGFRHAQPQATRADARNAARNSGHCSSDCMPSRLRFSEPPANRISSKADLTSSVRKL